MAVSKKKSSGRNKLPAGEKKKEIRLFVPGNKINALGGEKKLKKQLYNAIETLSENSSNSN